MLIKEKNLARRIARRLGDQADKRTANEFQWEVRKALSEFRNEQWHQKLQSLSIEENSIWNTPKILKSEYKPLPPIHGPTGRMVYTDEEKAEAFADRLQLKCRQNLVDADLNHMNKVGKHVKMITRKRPTQRTS